jgi:hypothetical protein
MVCRHWLLKVLVARVPPPPLLLLLLLLLLV